MLIENQAKLTRKAEWCGRLYIPSQAVRKKMRTILLEPLGKSTTMEDHERIYVKNRETETETEKPKNRNQ